MKKILFIALCFLTIPFLTSCLDTRIRDIDGIRWEEECFNIVATSEQLQNEYYSHIEVNHKSYSCRIALMNSFFTVELIDPTKDETIYFFGDTRDFLWGVYAYDDLVKEKDKDYKYSLLITLNNTGQYFEYCESNNLSFPKTITLYGYEAK